VVWQDLHAGLANIQLIPVPFREKRLKMWNQDLTNRSLDTAKMFAGDATSAGYTL
jgi:hypothetical protein